MRKIIHRTASIIQIFTLSPMLFFKKAWGRVLLSVVPPPKGSVLTKVGDHTIITHPSRNDWWKSMYIGYCGTEITQNIKRYLPRSGIFIDVGGGIGYFSAIASKIVGSSGQIHCFEPFPLNAAAIKKMIERKPDSNIILNDYALGIDNAVHQYYIKKLNDSTIVSMVNNLISSGEVSESLSVRVRRLDQYLEEKNISQISLIKIDVEGYEYLVLKGIEGYFKKRNNRPPIICEISPLACLNLGYTLREFHDYMKGYGYQSYKIFNPKRTIDIRTINDMTDVIFRAE